MRVNKRAVKSKKAEWRPVTVHEVLDAGLWAEEVLERAYRDLDKAMRQLPSIPYKLTRLEADQRDHRKILRKHRKALLGSSWSNFPEEEAQKLVGVLELPELKDQETLNRALAMVVRFLQGLGAFYEKRKGLIPDREARILLDVLASECAFHRSIINRWITHLHGCTIKLVQQDYGRRVLVAVG